MRCRKRKARSLKGNRTFPVRCPRYADRRERKEGGGPAPHGQADVVRHVVPGQREVERAHGDRRRADVRGEAAEPGGLRHPHPQPRPPAAPPAPAPRLPAAAPRHARSGSTIPSSTSTTTCAALSLPAPGDDAQFHELVGEILSPPLDRSHPLWELVLVDGFEDERFAVVYKTHHAMADGFSAVDIGTLLFDVEPNPSRSGMRSPGSRSPRRPASALVGRAVTGIWATFAPPGALARRARSGDPGRAAQARRRRPRRPLGGDLGADQAGAEGAAQRRDRPRPQLLLGRLHRSPTSS